MMVCSLTIYKGMIMTKDMDGIMATIFTVLTILGADGRRQHHGDGC